MKGKNNKGFTIVEVVLVLAIAGLIFLMVFVALPALQRSQRDTARKNDVSYVVTAVASYMSNNRGSFPADNAALTPYIGSNTSTNTTSTALVDAADSDSQSDGVIHIMKGKQCGSTSATTVNLTAGTSRQYVVMTLLEAAGGSGVAYCQNG